MAANEKETYSSDLVLKHKKPATRFDTLIVEIEQLENHDNGDSEPSGKSEMVRTHSHNGHEEIIKKQTLAYTVSNAQQPQAAALFEQYGPAEEGIDEAKSDASEHETLRVQLRKECNLLQTVIDSAPNHLAHLDRDFNFVLVNKSYAKGCGYSQQELTGQNHFVLFPNEENEQIFNRVRDTGIAEGFHDKPFTYPDQPERGITYWDWILTPTKADDGNVMGLVLALMETTHRHNAELALRRSEVHYRKLYESLRDPFVMVAMDGRIIECNDLFYEMLGYTPQEMHALRYQDLTPGRWHDFEKKILREQIIARGYSDVYEKEYQCKDGTIIPVELRTILSRDETGKPHGMWGIVRNITARKRMEEQIHRRVEELAAANRELESFSYSVSHDLRSPLNTINCLNEILNDEFSDRIGKDGRNILDRIKTSIRKMAATIDDILRLTGITRETMNRQWIDLSFIVKTIVHELRQTEPQRKVTIDIAKTLPAFADARLMTIALSNLIGNAWKYTSKNPDACIEVGIQSATNGDTFFIRDNGAGFDMRFAHKLFQPFQRLHSENQFPGTGIGLAIVEKIVQRHGGKIRAESEIGNRTTFFFTIACPEQAAL